MRNLTTLVALAVSLVTSAVFAETVHVTKISRDGSKLTIIAPEPFGGYGQVYAGLFTWDIDPSQSDGIENSEYLTDGSGNVISFCIDLIEYIGTDYLIEDNLALAPKPDIPDTTTEDPNLAYPMGAEKALAIEELWIEHIAQARQGGDYADVFQIALWEIIFEKYPDATSDWNVKDGDFKWVYSYDVREARNLANDWLDEIDGKDAEGNDHLNIDLIAWVSPIDGSDCGGRQDQLVQRLETSNGNTTIPEPAVVAQLAGLGLMFGVGGLRRNRRRRQK